MIKYEFSNLSPVEFEELSRDLLQKHLRIVFESFKEGKDQGIDLRWSSNDEKNIVIQCKRYSDYKSLFANLKKEVLKVTMLNPQRYIIVTSAGLTPKNKTDIKKLFNSYIVNTFDIYGKDDLNNLIGLYSDIEKKHYKLWMSSTSIMNKLLHASVSNRSNFLTNNIKEDIKLFVQNKSFFDAVKILNENNFVIISGNPGVGKSTLAKMLVYQYIAEDFEVVEISEDIEEAYNVWVDEKKQVFFYDDFLGSNFFEQSIAKNEDKRLYSFMERVKRSNDKKLIMTTREYILNQARYKFEVLSRNDVNLANQILDIEVYTKVVKAEILYNHLFFSSIPNNFKYAVLREKNYNKIINHKNYNPRVIESLTLRLNTKLVTSEVYVERILTSLENPSEIWQPAFENQISELSRYILYFLTLSNGAVTEELLIESVLNMIKKESNLYFTAASRGDFIKSFKELDNTFVRIYKNYKGATLFQFQNPSVRDFLIHYIERDKQLQVILIGNLNIFNFMFNLFKVYNNKKNLAYYYSKKDTSHKIDMRDKKNLFEDKIIREFDKMIYLDSNGEVIVSESINEKLIYLHDYYDYSNSDLNELISNKLKTIDLESFEFDERETLVDVIKSVQLHLTIDTYQFFDSYMDCINCLSDVRGLIELSKLFPDDFQKYLSKHKDYFDRSVADAVDIDISEISKNEDEILALMDELNEVEKYFNGTMDKAMDDLKEMLNELEQKEESVERSKLRPVVNNNNNDLDIDIKIDNMFSALLHQL